MAPEMQVRRENFPLKFRVLEMEAKLALLQNVLVCLMGELGQLK